MKRIQFLEKLAVSNPGFKNRAINEHIVKIGAMTETEFQVHYVLLQEKKEKFRAMAKHLVNELELTM